LKLGFHENFPLASLRIIHHIQAVFREHIDARVRTAMALALTGLEPQFAWQCVDICGEHLHSCTSQPHPFEFNLAGDPTGKAEIGLGPSVPWNHVSQATISIGCVASDCRSE